MPEEQNPTGGEPRPEPAAPSPKKKITCESCDCVLAPSGDALELSPKYKKFRDAADEVERLKLEVTHLKGRIAELEATPDPVREESSHRLRVRGT